MTLSLFDYRPPEAKPSAPEGVRRAARAGSRGVDVAILRWARANVGVVRPREVLRAYVEAEVGKVDPETPARRLRALVGMGLVGVARAGLGCVRVEWVKAP